MKHSRLLLAVALICTWFSPVAHSTSCYLIGDSVAANVASAFPQCGNDTQPGLTTADAVTRYASLPSVQLTIIALGRDDSNPSYASLMKLRKQIHSPHVMWILPPEQDKKLLVESVAILFKDKITNK